MILLIISGLLLLIIPTHAAISERHVPFGILIAMFVFLILTAVNVLVGLLMPGHTTYETKELASLQDSLQTEGSFFLGIGSADGRPKYAYYVDHGDYSTFETTNARDVKIYTDTQEPYALERTGCESKYKWLAYCYSAIQSTVQEIHVPEGTIKRNYNLDAQ